MMITVDNIYKRYKKGNQNISAIDGMSFEIASGDFISIVGKSGSGKSSLLLVLGGMLSPSEGKIYIDSTSLYDVNHADRAAIRKNKIGFVFQTFNLIPYLTALQNVELPLLLNGMDEKLQKERAVELLDLVGLGDRLLHKPNELSIGQQQRVALARMLANNPKIILADEPTGNLDSETCKHVMDFLTKLNEQGKTIILVTHDLDVAKQAKRVIHISNGKISNSYLNQLCDKEVNKEKLLEPEKELVESE